MNTPQYVIFMDETVDGPVIKGSELFNLLLEKGVPYSSLLGTDDKIDTRSRMPEGWQLTSEDSRKEA